MKSQAQSPTQEEMENEDDTTLTRVQLVDVLFEQTGLKKSDAKNMVEAFFDLIGQQLANGNVVKLHGFGQFHVRDKPQRPGRNPRTGESFTIAARRVVVFHASGALRRKIRQWQKDIELKKR